MSALEIRVLPVASLIPAPYNPRRDLSPNSPAYRKLAASLREFGLVEPLVWNEVTGHVVGGHMRLRILKEMGVAEVPVSVVRLSPERDVLAHFDVMIGQVRHAAGVVSTIFEMVHAFVQAITSARPIFMARWSKCIKDAQTVKAVPAISA